MKYCKHLKKRKNKPYCCIQQNAISLSQCQGCVNKEYKTKDKQNSVYKSKNAQNNQITVQNNSKNNNINSIIVKKSQKKKKYHIKKRITVSKEVYNAVIERDNYSCRLMDNSPCDGWLELHHIFYRSERKDLINDVNNCIMLCVRHHKLVHKNKKYWQPILIDMNKNKE